MVDRVQSHRLLDAVLDALECAEGANDPASSAAAEERAHEMFIALAVAVAHPLYAARQGAAMAGLRPDEIGGSRSKAEAAGVSPVTAEMLRDLDGRTRVRRVLARFVLDFAPLLPPMLAHRFAAELYMLNQGGKAEWLARPSGLKGLPEAAGQRALADVVLLCSAYYYAGHDNIAVEAAARRNGAVGRDWQALSRTRQKLGLTSTCGEWRAQGAADRAAGRPASPPLAATYDKAELEKLLRNLLVGRAE